MFNKIKNNQKNLFIITDIIILFLPIFFIIGAPGTNFATLILSLCFLYYCSKNNQWNLFKKKWVIFFLLFWLYNIFNSLFANDVVNALRASFFYVRFLLFSLAIIYIGLNFIKIKNFNILDNYSNLCSSRYSFSISIWSRFFWI